MIHGSTIVHWLDTNDHDFGRISIAKLFQRYSVKSKRISDDEYVITFDESDSVKVADWTGWTELQAIHKVTNPDGLWRIISVGEESISVSDDTLIPTYSFVRITGFHGENKYPYTVKEVKELNREHVVRVNNPTTDAYGYDGLYHIDIISNKYYDDTTYGYKLITRSKFFNANKFHMYGSDTIPTGIKYK